MGRDGMLGFKSVIHKTYLFLLSTLFNLKRFVSSGVCYDDDNDETGNNNNLLVDNDSNSVSSSSSCSSSTNNKLTATTSAATKYIKMGTVPSVTVIHSSNVQDDKEALLAIFPNQFHVEETQPTSNAIILIEEKITIVLIPSSSSLTENNTNDNNKNDTTIHPPSSFATLVLTEEMIKVALERSIVYGITIEETKILNTLLIKLTLPGGTCIAATTTDVWNNPSTRGVVVGRMLSLPIPVKKSNTPPPPPTKPPPPPTTIKTRNNDSPTTLRKVSFNCDDDDDDDKLNSNYREGSSSTKSNNKTFKRSKSMPDVRSLEPSRSESESDSSSRASSLLLFAHRLFPSLRTKISTFDGKFIDFPLNSQNPIPIETELFVGQLLLVMRPSNPELDAYWNNKIFSKKKRRVVMQLQGKLKYKPTGVVYAGMEVSDPMRLGLLATGLCSFLLKLIQKFNPNIHYSFGTEDEKGHIVFPASTFYERLIVTKPGDTPPPMGEEFVEDSKSVKLRKAYKTKIDWNTEDTYSMSFYSMYMDLNKWSVVNLPVNDMKLQTFWGNSLASVVFYELNSDSNDNGKINPDEKHVKSKTKYIVFLQMKYDENGAGNSEDDALTDADAWNDVSTSDSDSDDVGASESSTGGDIISDGGDGIEVQSSSSDPLSFEDVGGSGETITVNDDSQFFDTFECSAALRKEEEQTDGKKSIIMGPLGISATAPYLDLLRVIDKSCPCWIDMCSKRGTRYVTVYAFQAWNQNEKPLFRTWNISSNYLGDRQLTDVEDRFSHRLSPSERIRRILGLRYAEARAGKASPSRMLQFMKLRTHYDTRFLNQKTVPIIGASSSTMKKSGFVARAISDRHWIEEWMMLSSTNDIFFHHPKKNKPKLHISLSSVIKVEPMSQDVCPLLPTYYFMSIETLGRTICLMLNSKEERDEWVDIISKLLSKLAAYPTTNGQELSRFSSHDLTNRLMDTDNPMEEFLHKSTMWDCNKRRILNCRRLSLRTPTKEVVTEQKEPDEKHQQQKVLHQFVLVKEALSRATTLRPNGLDDDGLMKFLDCAAALKEADAHSLNERERLAFFINLYHIMIMHAYLVLGPPDSTLKWITYYNNIAYQCSDDIFSLTELEHNIIRSEMTFPSQFLSRFILPKSQYTFALASPDFRINFALNCGSLSIPTSDVPIYMPDSVYKQLDTITTAFLEETVSVIEQKNTVVITLPRICQWFANDFGDGSMNDIIKTIELYLRKEKRELLRKYCWNHREKRYDLSIWNVKILPFSFECRYLTLDDSK